MSQSKKLQRHSGTPEWYIEVEGSRVGPYTPEEVDTLASAGILNPTQKIFHPQQKPDGMTVHEFTTQSIFSNTDVTTFPLSSTNVLEITPNNVPGDTSKSDPDQTRVSAVMEAFEATKLTHGGPTPDNGLTEVTPPPAPTDFGSFDFSSKNIETSATSSNISSGPFSPPPRPQEVPEGTGLIRIPNSDGSFESPMDPATQLFEAVQLAKEKKATLRSVNTQRLEDLSLQAYTDGIQEKKSRSFSPQLFTLIIVIAVCNIAVWGIWGFLQKADTKNPGQNIAQSMQNSFGRLTSLTPSTPTGQNPPETSLGSSGGRAPAAVESPAERERKRIEREKKAAEDRARKEKLDAERRADEERKRLDRLDREEREREEKEREREEKERDEAFRTVDDPVRELSGEGSETSRQKRRPSTKNFRDSADDRDPKDFSTDLPRDPNDLLNDTSNPDRPNPIE